MFKGKKMAGHMGAAAGHRRRTLKWLRTDIDRGLILVKGAVPGSKGGWVSPERCRKAQACRKVCLSAGFAFRVARPEEEKAG